MRFRSSNALPPSEPPDSSPFGEGHNAPSILAVLPEPVQSAPSESFNDRILLLLAAVASSGGLLTCRSYQMAQDATRAIFGERALHAGIQAKLHFALLNPPTNAPEIARSMAEQAEEQKVAASFVDTMLKALASLTEHTEGVDESAQELVREIEWAFRRSWIEQNASKGFLNFNMGERLTNLCRQAMSQASNVIRPERKAKSVTLTPETKMFNAEMAEASATLERIAWTLDDKSLLDELHVFQKTIQEQPFKIVIVGERKRGKSSLINAIIGQKLSPVRESTPETATVLEFHNATAPDYSVRFLDSVQFSRLEDYLAGEEKNLLLASKVEAIRKGVAEGTFIPGKLLSGISCWDDLEDYVSLDGRFSGFVASVSVGLPLEMLQSGVVLIDTPGLNDTDQFHDYLAYEESLEADCVLFVMDARDPGSRSELDLLRKLARSGRAVCLIGALTSIDKLNDTASLEQSLEQARTVLLEACRESQYMRLVGLIAVNARKAMEERCEKKSEEKKTHYKPEDDPTKQEITPLLQLLRQVLDTDSGKAQYRNKVSENYERLVHLTGERVHYYMETCRASLPGQNLLEMLEKHSEELNTAAWQSLDQAKQVITATGQDIDDWERAAAKDLTKFQENLVLRLMDAVHRKMNELNHDFANEEAWKDFESNEARLIFRKAVDEFLEEQLASLHRWEEKLRLFSTNMDNFSHACLEKISEPVAGLPEEDEESVEKALLPAGAVTRFLVQTHQHMKKLAVFSLGLAVGRSTIFTPLAILFTAGNILALTAGSPITAVVLAAMAGTAGFLYHFGREDKRKAAFLEKKQHEVETWVAKVSGSLTETLTTARNELGKACESEVRRSFAPSLESLFQQTAHIKLFLKVMQKIRSDSNAYEERVQKSLEQLRLPS